MIVHSFKEAYCINLNYREDRWEAFQEGLPADWPFVPVRRFGAIDGKKVTAPPWWNQGPGAWGCYRSHLSIIEDCLNRGVKSVLLLEDDCLFPEDFSQKVTRFLEAVPPDWEMVYFGGQHLHGHSHPPQRVNEEVYRPYNVNRTHAYGLRGRMLGVVYRHLNRQDWSSGLHIDHQLGLLAQQGQYPIYCPAQWLVGQAEGKSNVSGREFGSRVWPSAERLSSLDPESHPFVAIVGLHSSGSSAVAGVLYHLGFHLGNKLGGYYGSDPETACGFEAVGLASICETAIPFPSTSYHLRRGEIWSRLRRWINEKRSEAKTLETIAAGKYPMLCRMGDQLVSICGDNLRVIHCSRPIEESIESLIRRCPDRDPEELVAHQLWLDQGRQDLLEKAPSSLTVNYNDLLDNPEREVANILGYLGRFVPGDRIETALRSIDPNKRHVCLTV